MCNIIMFFKLVYKLLTKIVSLKDMCERQKMGGGYYKQKFETKINFNFKNHNYYNYNSVLTIIIYNSCIYN